MYLARLMGFDYTIQYRSGNHNQEADALSRLPEQDQATFMILSMPCLTFMEELRRQLANHQSTNISFNKSVITQLITTISLSHRTLFCTEAASSYHVDFH